VVKPALLLYSALICTAQTEAPSDPTLDSTGLPQYLKMLPQPKPEPWRKITEKDRFADYAYLNFSTAAVVSSMFGAAISQALDSPHEWGQGWGPYGVRVASSYGSSFVAYTITYGTSALFRDDNRYFRSNKNTLGARLGRVIVSPYVAHNDAGQLRFSTSSFLGGVGGATIPLKWSPASWQGWNNVGINYAIWYGGVAGVNFVREFYPTLVRYYKNKGRNARPLK
jgi:hypothetical protein